MDLFHIRHQIAFFRGLDDSAGDLQDAGIAEGGAHPVVQGQANGQVAHGVSPGSGAAKPKMAETEGGGFAQRPHPMEA